jgi:hypothetical protein
MIAKVATKAGRENMIEDGCFVKLTCEAQAPLHITCTQELHALCAKQH